MSPSPASPSDALDAALRHAISELSGSEPAMAATGPDRTATLAMWWRVFQAQAVE